MKTVAHVVSALLVYMLIASCEVPLDPIQEEPKEPKVFQYKYYGLHVGDSVPVLGEYLDKTLWNSWDYFVAEIDNSQRIIPKHIGQATIEGLGFIEVEVIPRNTDYVLPFTSYFDFPPAIIRYVEENEGGRFLNPRSSYNLLVYDTGNRRSPYIVYMFTNGKCTMSGALIDLNYLSTLTDFLSERFEINSVDLVNYSASFTHKRGRKGEERIDYVGAMQYYDYLGGLLIGFMKGDTTKSDSINDSLDMLSHYLSVAFQE